MSELISAIYVLTGIFWILTFAWFVGWVADKCGISKPVKEQL